MGVYDNGLIERCPGSNPPAACAQTRFRLVSDPETTQASLLDSLLDAVKRRAVARGGALRVHTHPHTHRVDLALLLKTPTILIGPDLTWLLLALSVHGAWIS